VCPFFNTLIVTARILSGFLGWSSDLVFKFLIILVAAFGVVVVMNTYRIPGSRLQVGQDTKDAIKPEDTRTTTTTNWRDATLD
jgi:hypothetical protein